MFTVGVYMLRECACAYGRMRACMCVRVGMCAYRGVYVRV